MRRLTALFHLSAALAVVACFAALGGGGASFAAEIPRLPVVQLRAGLYLIHAEVASRPEELQRGLMFRSQLGQNHGMLFVFAQRGTQCMWMLNTLIPLDVAFLLDDGTIVNIEAMQPNTRTSHCSAEPVRLALEMNAGWFAQRKLGPGDVIRGIPALAPLP